MTHTGRFQYTSQILIGSFLLLIGTAFLFDNLDIIDVDAMWRHWPVLIIAIGVGKFLQAEDALDRERGVWWMFLGTWLYVSVFKLFGFGFRDSWPILLIGWGMSIVWKSLVPQRTDIERKIHHG